MPRHSQTGRSTPASKARSSSAMRSSNAAGDTGFPVEPFQEWSELVVGSEWGVHVIQGGQHPLPKLRACRGCWLIHGRVLGR
jgi:hypothetical protein